jgi:hypothetical protein
LVLPLPLLGAAAAMGADRIAAAATDAVAIFHFMAFLLMFSMVPVALSSNSAKS